MLNCASAAYFDRYPCLANKSGSDVDRVLRDNLELLQKHIPLLEASQTEEEEYFWRDLARSNLLAYLYGKFKDYDKQRDQIKKTLAKDGWNITALMMKLRLSDFDGSLKQTKEACQQLDALQENSDEQKVQKIIAKAELAYAFSCLSPQLYQQAIATYESVITDYCQLGQGSATVTTMNYTGWCFHLGQTYSRTLNKGRLGRLNAAELFGKVHERLATVIDSADKFYKGKAMVELVDAYKKCETAIHRCEMKFPIDNVDPDEYIFQAMREVPDDPYVLERCGRHYRQRATTKKQFLEAIAVLRKATELFPSRHVSWHHMGLAYRSLWLETGKYEEARLHRNNAKKGHKKRVAAGKKPVLKYDSQDSHSTMKADETSCTYRKLCHSVGKRSVDYGKTRARRNACGYGAAQAPANGSNLDQLKGSQISAVSSSEQKENVTDREDATVILLPKRAPTSLPTLQPKVPAPKQSRSEDYFDTLRSNNPLAKEMEEDTTNSTEFLKEALKCFKRACDLAQISCRYFIDLGRTYISLREPGEAKKCFLSAHRRCMDKEDNDSQYLYEQWAMLLEQTDLANDDTEITEVMDKYRKAILAAVRAKVKSKISYYRLRRILAEKESENDAYRLEYGVLYRAEKSPLKENCEQVLVTAMRQNKDDICTVAFKMIDLLHERSAMHDSFTAYLYLTALQQSGRLILRRPQPARSRSSVRDENEVTPAMSLSADTIIDIVTSMRIEGKGDDEDKWDALRNVYRWYVGERSTSSTTSSQSVEFDVCILAPKPDSPGAALVESSLKEKLRLEVCLATLDGNCDLQFNKPIIDGIAGLIELSNFVILIEDTSTEEGMTALCDIADTFLVTPAKKVCLVAHPDHAAEAECSLPARYREAWRCIDIQHDNVDSTAVSIVRRLASFYGY